MPLETPRELRVGPEQPSGGNAALASTGFSKHFNSQVIWRHFLINQKIWRHFLINRPLERQLKVEGRVALFSPLTPVPIDPAPRRGVSLAPEVLPVTLSPTGSAG